MARDAPRCGATPRIDELGAGIDRQDIVRTLIDRCDLATLLADG